MLGSCVFDKIQLLWGFKFTNQATVQRFVIMLFQMLLQTGFGFEDFVTLGTLFLDGLLRNVFREMLQEHCLHWGLVVALFTPEYLTNAVSLVEVKLQVLFA